MRGTICWGTPQRREYFSDSKNACTYTVYVMHTWWLMYATELFAFSASGHNYRRVQPRPDTDGGWQRDAVVSRHRKSGAKDHVEARERTTANAAHRVQRFGQMWVNNTILILIVLIVVVVVVVFVAFAVLCYYTIHTACACLVDRDLLYSLGKRKKKPKNDKNKINNVFWPFFFFSKYSSYAKQIESYFRNACRYNIIVDNGDVSKKKKR